jgi:tRNA-Thr(GGU) m(6)t(6)A37 methyltransferase TsaA
MNERYEVIPIGRVESPLRDVADAPRQGDEGAPAAWLILEPRMRDGIRDLQVGQRILVFTWFHRARRDVLTTRPRDDPKRPMAGIFSTRSPDRPNPIGMHPVQIIAIDGLRIQVSDLEAIDGTPILDIKPVLGPVAER